MRRPSHSLPFTLSLSIPFSLSLLYCVYSFRVSSFNCRQTRFVLNVMTFCSVTRSNRFFFFFLLPNIPSFCLCYDHLCVDNFAVEQKKKKKTRPNMMFQCWWFRLSIINIFNNFLFVTEISTHGFRNSTKNYHLNLINKEFITLIHIIIFHDIWMHIVWCDLLLIFTFDQPIMWSRIEIAKLVILFNSQSHHIISMGLVHIDREKKTVKDQYFVFDLI